MSLTALDYEKIRQLLIAYCHCLDFGDIDGYVQCFTADAVFEMMQPPHVKIASFYRGHDEIRAFAEAHWIRGAGQRGRHHILNSRIKEEGNGARVVSYHVSTKDGGMPGPGERVTASIHTT